MYSGLNKVEVKSLMYPAEKIHYVAANETLGPLVLDELYKTGFNAFPVKDAKGELVGAISTGRLNALEMRTLKKAKDLILGSVVYVREDYNLYDALDTFLRTGADFALVVDKFAKVVGILYFKDLCEFIFGKPNENFESDTDALSVAKRQRLIDLDAEFAEKLARAERLRDGR